MSSSVCIDKNEIIINLISSYFDNIKDPDEKNRVNAIYNVLEKSVDNISIKLKLMLLTRLIDNFGILTQQNSTYILLLNDCIIENEGYNSKANCDLDLILLIKNMKLDILHSILTNFDETQTITDTTIRFNDEAMQIDNYNKAIESINKIIPNITSANITIDSNRIKQININQQYTIYNNTTTPIVNNELIKSIEYINNYVKEDNTAKLLTNINMDEKIHIYTILHILIKAFYNGNNTVKKIYEKIITNQNTRCAPRSVFDTLDTTKGGYNNKSGDIEYQICKCNFKQNIKKVSAKSAREAAKIVANKVLKGDKKSITFSLKRIIGKKEKCYDYNASIDKSGKILIKSQ